MNVLNRDLRSKRDDVYKTNAAKLYGFATLLAIDDSLRSIIRITCEKIGVHITDEQLDNAELGDESVGIINTATTEIINNYSGDYGIEAISKMEQELNSRGIYVKIRFN